MVKKMRILAFLILNVANCYCNSQFYTIQKSTNVTDAFHQKYSIDEASKLSKFQCLAKCNQNIACVSVTYSIDQDPVNNCFLYNSTVNVSDEVLSNGFILFQKESSMATQNTTTTTPTTTTTTTTTALTITAAFSQSCLGIPCDNNLGLVCDPQTFTCNCDTESVWSTIYWKCIPKYYKSPCVLNSDCNATLGLSCKYNQCRCTSTFWSYISRSCIACPPGYYNYMNTYCYWLSQNQLSWADSKISCSIKNASLAIVISQGDFNFIQMAVGTNIWLDAKYSSIEKNFVWIDNSFLFKNNTFWVTASNQNNTANECVYWSCYSNSGKLNNANCNETMFYACFFAN